MATPIRLFSRLSAIANSVDMSLGSVVWRCSRTWPSLAEAAVVFLANPFEMVPHRSFAGIVRQRNFIMPAFEGILGSPAAHRNRHGKGPRKGGRIGKRGHIVVTRTEVVEDKPLGDVDALRGEFAGAPEARLGIQIADVDDQRIALPVTARISLPQLDLLGQVLLIV